MSKKEEESRATRAQKIVSKYQRVFGSSEGRDVLHDMMKSNFVLRSTFVPGDAQATAYQEGQRESVLAILNMLKLDPSQFLNVVNENKEGTHVEI